MTDHTWEIAKTLPATLEGWEPYIAPETNSRGSLTGKSYIWFRRKVYREESSYHVGKYPNTNEVTVYGD